MRCNVPVSPILLSAWKGSPANTHKPNCALEGSGSAGKSNVYILLVDLSIIRKVFVVGRQLQIENSRQLAPEGPQIRTVRVY